MISDKDIDYLSGLARIELPPEEKELLRRDLDAIVDYISELKESGKESPSPEGLSLPDVNVLRADNVPLPADQSSADLLAAAPAVQNGYFKVKRVK